jgi:hypothetical protein
MYPETSGAQVPTKDWPYASVASLEAYQEPSKQAQAV